MSVMRLVITGAVGAGKSTFIRTASDIEVVNTDRVATDHTSLIKKNTTVAMDFGRFTFGTAMTLHLYGTPGQSRFDFMWDMLIAKAHAYVVLVAAHRPEDFRYTRQILSFMSQRVTLPMLLGITHLDHEDAWALDDIALVMDCTQKPGSSPVLAIDANNKESVIQALITLVEHCMHCGTS